MKQQTFKLIIKVKRVKFLEALPKQGSSLIIRFNKDKKIPVPEDPTNQRNKGPSITDFIGGEKSSATISLKLLESTNKVLVELMNSQLI